MRHRDEIPDCLDPQRHDFASGNRYACTRCGCTREAHVSRPVKRAALRIWRRARAGVRLAALATTYRLGRAMGDPETIFAGPPDSSLPCLMCDSIGICRHAYKPENTAGRCLSTEMK